MTASDALEHGKSIEASVDKQALAVTQPEKLQGLLETIDLLDRVSEALGEDKSTDLGGSGAGATQGSGKATGQSTRAQKIANLPEQGVMQKQLERHIQREISSLQKEVKATTRKIGKKGSAHNLNELYARIRRLNGVLSELFDAGYEVVKRLFIRIFIDKQTVF